MNKRTIALLSTDVRDSALSAPFALAYAAEHRAGVLGRVSSVPVVRDGRYTIAACGDYGLAVALAKAVLG